MEKVELSGAATDVIHALFFRGALPDGDLPSKVGASELRELGFARTQLITAKRMKKTISSTFLTPQGQEFAIKFLVDSDFGK